MPLRVLNMVLLLLILHQLLQLWSVPMHLKVFLHVCLFLTFYQVFITFIASALLIGYQ